MYCIFAAFLEDRFPLAAPILTQISDADNRTTTRFQVDITDAIPNPTDDAGLSTLLFRVESLPGKYSYFWMVSNANGNGC